eukprot:6269737-Alexandrium_andersonii.AAC.1
MFFGCERKGFRFFNFAEGAHSWCQGDSLFVVDIETDVLQCAFNRPRRETAFRRGAAAISQAVRF